MRVYYQIIPKGGYTKFVEQILIIDGIEIRLDTDFFKVSKAWSKTKEVTYDKVLFAGMIDEYFDYKLGKL